MSETLSSKIDWKFNDIGDIDVDDVKEFIKKREEDLMMVMVEDMSIDKALWNLREEAGEELTNVWKEEPLSQDELDKLEEDKPLKKDRIDEEKNFYDLNKPIVTLKKGCVKGYVLRHHCRCKECSGDEK